MPNVSDPADCQAKGAELGATEDNTGGVTVCTMGSANKLPHGAGIHPDSQILAFSEAQPKTIHNCHAWSHCQMAAQRPVVKK